ncbi:hypothetical protein GGI42DRAFT_91820 [Trichoderma sp. SZMC 28013]
MVARNAIWKHSLDSTRNLTPNVPLLPTCWLIAAAAAAECMNRDACQPKPTRAPDSPGHCSQTNVKQCLDAVINHRQSGRVMSHQTRQSGRSADVTSRAADTPGRDRSLSLLSPWPALLFSTETEKRIPCSVTEQNPDPCIPNGRVEEQAVTSDGGVGCFEPG